MTKTPKPTKTPKHAGQSSWLYNAEAQYILLLTRNWMPLRIAIGQAREIRENRNF